MRPSLICARFLVAASSLVLTSCGSLQAPSPTVAPTQTPAVTATIAFPTLVPSSTATPPAGPIASPSEANAGPLLFQADFTSEEGWLVGADADGGSSLSGGSLTIAVSRPSASRYVLAPVPPAADFLLEATVRASLCAEEDEVGLLFRTTPPGDCYRFTLSCSGVVRLTRVLGTSAVILAGPASASSAIPGSPSENRLAILARGPEFAFYVNGVEVLRSRDTSLPSGAFGFFVRSASQGQTTAALTSLTARAVDSDPGALTPAPDDP